MLSTSTSSESANLQYPLSSHHPAPWGTENPWGRKTSSWILMEEQLLHPGMELIQISSAKEGHNNTKTSQKR